MGNVTKGSVDSQLEADRGATDERLVPRRHYVRTALALVLAAYVVSIAHSLVTNDRFNWAIVGQYMFDPLVLQGLLGTLELTVVSLSLGLVLGFVISQLSFSESRMIRAISITYVWLFRSLPLLVLLLLLYNVGALYTEFSIGLPIGPALFSVKASSLTPFVVAVIAFALHEAAYSSEVFRASVRAVPVGQVEAATALGMTKFRTMRRIVFPSAIRVALPPLMNQLVLTLKGTAIVAFIAYPDLLFTIQKIYTRNYEVLPLLVVASIWYFILVSLATVAQQYVEYRLAKATRRHGTAPPPLSVRGLGG